MKSQGEMTNPVGYLKQDVSWAYRYPSQDRSVQLFRGVWKIQSLLGL